MIGETLGLGNSDRHVQTWTARAGTTTRAEKASTTCTSRHRTARQPHHKPNIWPPLCCARTTVDIAFRTRSDMSVEDKGLISTAAALPGCPRRIRCPQYSRRQALNERRHCNRESAQQRAGSSGWSASTWSRTDSRRHTHMMWPCRCWRGGGTLWRPKAIEDPKRGTHSRPTITQHAHKVPAACLGNRQRGIERF
ncbi:hypothetical protein BDV95DRAFT_573642 [Massariosphaeria phaeospora]|uniref:Uncharacterized protein n=1 Tax=Massariosphaeria phaeospora TaxID=100035 RepID=A0A7C8I932_9PLEO|nr:hypothetical protein BDV95DRAFT_573642 [Massariosphaeria phaeospora]